MEWTGLQTTARSRGTLVFAMRQAETPPMTQPGPWGLSSSGYCRGLAALWASYCYKGKTFPVDSSKVCDNPPWQATMSQTVGTDAMTAGVWTSGWQASVEALQMSLSGGLRAWRDTHPTPDFIYSIVTKAYGCYGVRLERTGGAHAIALRHGKDNRMHLFDANYGHFAVTDHTLLKDFLRWYLAETGYVSLYTKTGVVGIVPTQS